MSPEEFFAHPEVRKTLALTYWRGRLQGQLMPGFVKLDEFVDTAVKAGTLAGGLQALYEELMAADDAVRKGVKAA
jgi:hypothetical protein